MLSCTRFIVRAVIMDPTKIVHYFGLLLSLHILVIYSKATKFKQGVRHGYRYGPHYDSKFDVNRTPTGRYIWKEHTNVHFTCPRGTFISNLSYNYDVLNSTVSQPFQTWSLSDTLHGKFTPENVATLRRHRALNVSNLSDLAEDTQNSVSRTGCDALLFCLGYQACLFQLSMELCVDDPDSLKVKHLKLELTCSSDDNLYNVIQTLTATQQRILADSNDKVMYVSYDKEATDDIFTVIKAFVLPEKDVFWINCPATMGEALRKGYGGWCGRRPPKQLQISNELWHVLARSTEASCRDELLQVYCAYHLNKTGGCVPPMYVQKPKNGSKLRPGIMRFNFKALPTIGHRPDLEEYRAVRNNPNAAVIPVKFAFLIIAHTCEDCVLQLIDLLYRPYFFYVVHVDFRQDQVRNELKRKIALNPGYTNVRVLPKERSFTASWGSYNILRAELEGIEELARMGVWDFVINLSGADLPFTDVDDLAAMYASYRTRNFISARKTWKESSPAKKDISVWHACGDHVYNVTSRGPPPTWSTQLSASQWFILDRGFATTVIDQNYRSRRLNNIQFFQQTCIVPDESYLSSMLFNSAFRGTYVFDHSRLYRFPKSPLDKRGLCKHSSDIDYCGQSPINLARSNIKLFKLYSRMYNFGRKHEYNIRHPTRKAAVNTVKGMDMYRLVAEKKSVTKVFIRQLVDEALRQKFGPRWYQKYEVQTVIKVRILRVPFADNLCCDYIYQTFNRLPNRYKYWIDFSVNNLSTNTTIFLRASMKPIDNVKCFVNGDIKALSVSFLKDPFVPHEPQIKGHLHYTIFFNRGPWKGNPKCKELPDSRFKMYDIIRPNNSEHTYARFETGRNMNFKVTLISPTGTQICHWYTTLILSAYDKTHNTQTRSTAQVKTSCSKLTKGWWSLLLQQDGVENPFPYTASMFVGSTGGNWLTLSDNIKGLWNLEAMAEITVDDIELQSKWSRITHLDLQSKVLNISKSSFTKINKTLSYVMKYDSEQTIGKDTDDQNGHMIRMLRQEPMSDVRLNVHDRPIHVKPKNEWSMFEIKKISIQKPSITFLKCMMITSTIFLILKWFVLRKWLAKVYGVKSIIKSMLLFLIIHSLVYLSNFYL